MDYLYSGMQLLVCAIEIGLFYIWGKAFVGTRKTGKGWLCVLLILMTALLYATSFLQSDLLSSLLACVILFGMGIVFLVGKRRVILFYTITYCAMGMAIALLMEKILPIPVLTLVIVQAVVMAIMIKVIRPKRNSQVLQTYTGFLILPFCIYGITMGFYTSDVLALDINSHKILVAIGCAGIIVLGFVICYLAEEFSELLEKYYEFEMKIAHEKLEKKHYEDLEKMQEQYDIFLHDMKHTMKTIAVLSEGENSKEIGELIEKMKITLGGIEQKRICSHKILNTILVEKSGYANDRGIDLELDIKEPLHLQRIEDLDLIALMGNLLDNALAAESKVKNPKGVYCRMAMSREGLHIIIQIENSCENSMFASKVRPTGKIGAKHGIGLKSTEEIVRKYCGIMDSARENGRYWTKIIIPVR